MVKRWPTCDVCDHTPAHCNCAPVFKVALGGVTVTYATVLPKEIIKRISDLAASMRDDHRGEFADEVDAIFEMCERYMAQEFDVGFDYAQETVGSWH